MTVVRNGQRVDLSLLQGGDAKPAMETTVEVEVSLMRERTEEQRALLAAIVRG